MPLINVAGLGQDKDASGSWDIPAPTPGTVSPAATAPTPDSGGGFDWGALNKTLQAGINTAGNLLKLELTPRGTYTQTGPQGTITYVQPAGQQANVPFVAGQQTATYQVGTGGVTSSTVLWGGLGIIGLILVMSALKKNR
jgi:hypothetical protein